MDEDLVTSAQEMAVVYTAIAAFENSAREFIEKRLLEEVGEDWWAKSVPQARRAKAESRREEENKIRWHAKRGDSFLQYTEIEDLAAIIVTQQQVFAPMIPDPDWAKQIFRDCRAIAEHHHAQRLSRGGGCRTTWNGPP